MLHIQFPRRTALSLLTGLALLVPTALAASAAPEADLQTPAPVVGAAILPSPEHPQVTPVTGGYEIDRGGPGTYFERLADDGE